MTHVFYRALTALTELMGPWVFRLVSWWIATGYFFLFPKRVSVGLRFYGAVFPGRSLLYRIRCTWRQYHNFTHVFLDRVLLRHPKRVSWTSRGLEHLVSAAEQGRGGIILMSHVGNWEIAARLLRDKGIRLLLYMGIKDKERIEKLQKDDLSRNGVTVIAVEKERESPLELLEGIRFIEGGGFVSLTGDRLWRADQRSLEVTLFNRSARIPETPHIMALLSKSPLFVFFIFRTGRRSYHITCSEPQWVLAPDRRGRGGAIASSARTYAGLLEEAVREHPTEWFHFEQFLGD